MNVIYSKASLRADWIFRFGERAQVGVFPSASAAWRISEEGFMADQDIF